MKHFLLLSLALLPLSGCNFWSETTPAAPEETSESPLPETKNVVYRGRLLSLGTSIYMEGTHRLELEDGRFVLLESSSLLLDDYLNEEVEVFGATRPTVEGGSVIMRVENVARVAASEEASSATADSSSAATEAESSSTAAAVSSTPVVASKPTTVPSSTPPPPPTPSVSSAPATSSAGSDDAVSLRAATMAKANMDPANWTQEYCSPAHLSFCFPVHKNWWYTSFGATSSSQWHVEVSSEELESLGDGPIHIVLVSGAAPGPDGQVTNDGTLVTGIRAWTDNRHFIISASAVLDKAVRYITQELHVAPTATE